MILSLLIWLASIIIPGYLLSNLLVKTDKFLERVAYSLALGSCILVAVFFARNFIPFPIELASLVFFSLGFFLFGLNIGRKEKFSFPKPSRIEAIFLSILTIQVLMIVTALAKFPLFSPFALSESTYRIDYLATGSNVISYATVGPPALQGQFLYYAVHYHLAYLYALNPSPQNILLIDRLGMGILTVFSTFYLWLASERIFGSGTKALAVVAVYSLSGFLWIGMVLNAQLFPNFYGLMLASPFLIVAVKDVLSAKTASLFSFIMLGLTLFNALMSHYSSLLFFPILVIVTMRTKAPMGEKIVTITMLLLPLVIGSSLFYSLLLGYSRGTGGGPDLSVSWFATHAAFLPSLSYALLFVTNDYASIAMLGFASVYVYLAVKKRDAWGALPGLLFAFVILSSPRGSIAWRFAFIALLPLTWMVGSGLHSVAERVFAWLWETKRGVKIRLGIGQRRTQSGLTLLSCFSIMLLTSPLLYSSWGANTLAFSSYGITQNSKHDYAVYDAMQWMKNQTDRAFFYTANDGKFTASRLLIGVETDYQPSLLSNPGSAFAYGIQHQAKPTFVAGKTPDGFAYNMSLKTFPVYFIATSANPPFPCLQYNVTLSLLNATYGHAVRLRAEIFDGSTGHLFKQNVTSFFHANGTEILKMTVINGNTTGTLSFAKSGTYKINFVAGTIPSNTLTLFMGSTKPPLSTSIDPYACYPWAWQDRRPFSNLKVVYDDKTDVRIYEVAS